MKNLHRKIDKSFTCYICNENKAGKHKGLCVGSGFFLNYICKACSRSNYTTYGTSEVLKLSNKPEYVY